MSEIINIGEVLDYLPHRYPFILVDRVLEFEPMVSLTAIKNVTINEPFFGGHFPGNPVMPGVLMLEALAQACVILAYKSFDDVPKEERPLYFFAGIDNARFKQMVIPGDQLRLDVRMIKRKRGIWKVHGEATVDGNLACSADLMSATKG